MAYTINKTDGSILATVQDGTINTDTSIVIFGKNYAGYGEFLGENMVHLLENGANLTSPPNPLAGELWFDLTTGVLKVNIGDQDTPLFKNLGITSSNVNQPQGATIGDLWFDPTEQQLHVNTGSEFILVGPAFTDAAGNTGANASIIRDSNGTDHVVIELMVDDQLVGIVNKDATFVPASSIAGFTSINPGIQLATGQNFLFEGTARRALNLDNGSGGDLDVPLALDSKVNLSGDIMTGALTLPGDPSNNLHAATKIYVDTQIATGGQGPDPTKVDVAGDTMTGFLTLNADPISNLHAATMDYVNERVTLGGNSKVNVAGDTMTGDLTLQGAPTNNSHAATKLYVDTQVANAGGGGATFPPNTRMVFAQATAPVGWTQDVVNDDYMLRLVGDGSANTSGGTSSPIASHTHTVNSHSHSVNSHLHTMGSHTHSVPGHSHQAPAHSHRIPSHSHSVGTHTHATSAHTLTEAQMPSHSHKIPNIVGGADQHGSAVITNRDNNPLYVYYSQSAGGGGSHTHGNTQASTGYTGVKNGEQSDANTAANTTTTQLFTYSNTADNTGSTLGSTTASGGSTLSSYTPKYFNVMVAIKD